MSEILEGLKKAVIEYDSEKAEKLARKAVEEGIDPVKALDSLTEGIKQVGNGFGRGELWLPDLVAAGDTMQSATAPLEEEIKKRGKKRETMGAIVIGTVFGDIHSIGKDMVAALSRARGFEIIDLGVDVEAEKFLEAVRKHEPDILAMSALLTTTAPEQKKVIESLKEAGLRKKFKIAVGGGAVTNEFADEIGADGYEPTAPKAVDLFEKFVGNRGKERQKTS